MPKKVTKETVQIEREQLDKLTKQVSEKQKEIQAMDDHAKMVLKDLDKKREGVQDLIDKQTRQLRKISEAMIQLDKDQKKFKEEQLSLIAQREAVDNLAAISDERLELAKEKEDEVNKKLEKLKETKLQKESDAETLASQLQNKIDDLKDQKRRMNRIEGKLKEKIEMVDTEKKEAGEIKFNYETQKKEIEALKEQYKSKLNQENDREKKLREVSANLKEREVLIAKEKDWIKDENIKIDAMWIKINRKATILGLKKELGIEDKDDK